MTAGQASGHPPRTQPVRRRTALVMAIAAVAVGAVAVDDRVPGDSDDTPARDVEPTAKPVVTTIVVDARRRTVVARPDRSPRSCKRRTPATRSRSHRPNRRRITAPAPRDGATIDRKRRPRGTRRASRRVPAMQRAPRRRREIDPDVHDRPRRSRVADHRDRRERRARGVRDARSCARSRFRSRTAARVDEQQPMTFDAQPDPVRVPPPPDLPAGDRSRRGQARPARRREGARSLHGRQSRRRQADPRDHDRSERARHHRARARCARRFGVLRPACSRRCARCSFRRARPGSKLTVPVTPPSKLRRTDAHTRTRCWR